MDSKYFGAAIRAARKRSGITQRALAKEIPVIPCYMHKIEAGESIPSLPVAVAIANALGVGLDELTGTGQGEDVGSLKAANKQLGDQLHAAQMDLARLDACQVCGWWDGYGCQAPKDVMMSGSCFAWRGAERTKLWEDVT